MDNVCQFHVLIMNEISKDIIERFTKKKSYMVKMEMMEFNIFRISTYSFKFMLSTNLLSVYHSFYCELTY